eukprot:TRINITY_DN7795_c0_g1_i1.p1 TRINITY_DN7795_c0_g1~~TRINITY_DN7795_c0_g1_i1.p1  ORF type:complete len:629 (-),score=114.18 TRINITY_DN7795_c0_g1_i1:251-2137(-)
MDKDVVKPKSGGKKKTPDTASLQSVSPAARSNRSYASSEEELYQLVLDNDRSGVVSIIERADINIDWRNPEDNMKTALHAAVDCSNSVLVALLVGKGAQVCVRDADDVTPLQSAISQGKQECVDILLEKVILCLEKKFGKREFRRKVPNSGRPNISDEAKIIHYLNAPLGAYNEQEIYGQRDEGHNGPRTLKQALKALEHRPRASTLTSMFKFLHFQTIYNQWIAMLVMGFGSIVAQNIHETGAVVDFSFLQYVFGELHLAVVLWFLMFFITHMAFTIQVLIARKILGPGFGCFIVYPVVLCLLYYLPTVYVLSWNLPPATSLIVTCEQARFAMKIHSYLFVNRALRMDESAKSSKQKKIDEMSRPRDPDRYPYNVSYQNFLYFMFAPTLVYQTSYPRTKHRSWTQIGKNLLEIVFIIFYAYVIFIRYCLPAFSESVGDYWSLTLATFKLMFPGIVILLLANYGILHCWQNAWAELLYFADRQFYLDWWNTVSWSGYYRKWNVVVHNFLYRHIYIPSLYTAEFGMNTSMWITFLISAFVHEFILAVSFRFFKPILLIMFTGPGVFFIYLTRGFRGNPLAMRFWNVFMWIMLMIGTGMLLTFYARASHFARTDPSTDYFATYLHEHYPH